MTGIHTLSREEHDMVGGGNPAPGQSWYDYLNERFPGGEWVGNSFYPNGAPDMPQGWSH
ncbi:hypothetical protein [Alteriqipengyuania lutimaris]|nr:hypothetical protein [Alteriqipengyuania lutimaris]MBB3032652.1 hypothetical protein [Alteriqipengyuania lutimaris]